MPVDKTKLPTLRLRSRGPAVKAAKMGIHKWNGKAGNTTPVYGPFLVPLVRAFKKDQRVGDSSSVIGPATWEALLRFIPKEGKKLLPQTTPSKPLWENIGPVQPGGVSLLDMSLTHPTTSIPLFPAIDTAWGGGGGVVVIAPEPCTVDTKDTSSSPGEAVYLTGQSKLRYWVGHLDRDWPLGHKFKKGDLIGRTLPIPGASDHAHWGVNAEALLGKGKELRWGDGTGTKYTHGAPTIRKQLEARTSV